MNNLKGQMENHLERYQEDRIDIIKIRQFQSNLNACDIDESYVEKVGRLRKEGAVEITKWPTSWPDLKKKARPNYLAIFDHRIIVGQLKSGGKVNVIHWHHIFWPAKLEFQLDNK